MGGIIVRPFTVGPSNGMDKDSEQTIGLECLSDSTGRKKSFGDDLATDCTISPFWKYMGVNITGHLLIRQKISKVGCNSVKWCWKKVEVIALEAPDRIKVHFEGRSPMHDKWLCLSLDDVTNMLAPMNFLSYSQIASGGSLDDSQEDVVVNYLITGKLPTDENCSEIDEEKMIENVEQTDTQEMCFFTGLKLEVRDIFKSKTDGSIVEKWREVKIIHVKGRIIRIHFLGWDKRWDEDIDTTKAAHRCDEDIDTIKAGHRLRPCKETFPVMEKASLRISKGLRVRGGIRCSDLNHMDTLSILYEASENSIVSSIVGGKRSSFSSSGCGSATFQLNRRDSFVTSSEASLSPCI